jgi:hypothetical protein
MLTILFYGIDGAAAKVRARLIAAHKPDQARIYDAFVWNGQNDACDAVEIFPCVPSWRREEIEKIFAGKVRVSSADKPDGQELATCSMFQAVPNEEFTIAPKRRGRPRKAS